jgi:imidazolonepropionase-like amidohydrolase
VSGRWLVGALLIALAGPAGAADLAVRAATLYVGDGTTVKDALVVVKDGKIAAVGPASSTAVPSGMHVVDAAIVTPGLIDAHCVVGLTGYLNQPTDQDQLDTSSPMQPELRAIDSYDAREHLIEWVRSFGVTTIHTGHAPGALIPGQTLVAKTRGDTVAEAVIVPTAMVACTLGDAALVATKDKSPGTRSKEIAMLREELLKAQAYVKKLGLTDESKRPDRDLHLEALAKVLAGEWPLLVTAQRHQDIDAVLRLREEFSFKLVLDGAAESYQLIPQIKAAGVPVIIHPTMARQAGELENASFETASKLRDAGILVALQGGYEEYVPKVRVVTFEAGVAAAHGLGFDGALRAVTIDAARVLGLESRIGSIEVGKDGDLALWDGNPFEYTTHCTQVVIEGEVFPGDAQRTTPGAE